MQESTSASGRRLELTADGSHTLFVPALDEHYHSVNGAVAESRHIFIEAGWKAIGKASVRMLEIGFGTGLNAFLTLLETQNSPRRADYFTVERDPLEDALVRQLNYPARIDPENESLFYALHAAPWGRPHPVGDRFSLHKIRGDANAVALPGRIDLIYFDAFAPDKQPDLWNRPLFDALYRLTEPGGVLVTYCAKGIVRRMLQDAGYDVERLPGPPGKREMLRARKKDERR